MSAVEYALIDEFGKEVGTVELPPEVFGVEAREDIIHSVVVWQLAKRRAGTHKALTRGEKEGGAKKPWKQKHTGRARAGSSISPHWVGGAVAHGPRPRSYESRLPKETRKQGLRMVLSEKVKNKKLFIVNNISSSGKTKELDNFLKQIKVRGTSSVIFVGEGGELVARAGRNIPKVLPLNVRGANVYDLLRHDCVVCTPEVIKTLGESLK